MARRPNKCQDLTCWIVFTSPSFITGVCTQAQHHKSKFLLPPGLLGGLSYLKAVWCRPCRNIAFSVKIHRKSSKTPLKVIEGQPRWVVLAPAKSPRGLLLVIRKSLAISDTVYKIFMIVLSIFAFKSGGCLRWNRFLKKPLSRRLQTLLWRTTLITLPPIRCHFGSIFSRFRTISFRIAHFQILRILGPISPDGFRRWYDQSGPKFRTW